MTGIELFENYFKQGDVFVWHRLISSVPIICEITDMQPGCNICFVGHHVKIVDWAGTIAMAHYPN